MVVTKCDLCGREMEGKPGFLTVRSSLTIGARFPYAPDVRRTEYDLCNDCAGRLRGMIEDGWFRARHSS